MSPYWNKIISLFFLLKHQATPILIITSYHVMIMWPNQEMLVFTELLVSEIHLVVHSASIYKHSKSTEIYFLHSLAILSSLTSITPFVHSCNLIFLIALYLLVRISSVNWDVFKVVFFMNNLLGFLASFSSFPCQLSYKLKMMVNCLDFYSEFHVS